MVAGTLCTWQRGKIVGCCSSANVQCISSGKQYIVLQEDWIGLKELDERGAVSLKECPGNHMQITEAYFQKHVIEQYLAVT